MALIISNRDLPFIHYLDSNGDGSGAKNAIGNHGGVPGVFKMRPAINATLSLISLTVSIKSTDLSLFKYNPGSILDKGIQVSIINEKEPLVVFPKVYKLADWATIAADWQITEMFFFATIDFPKLFGKSVMIYGGQKEELAVEIFDEISLLSQTFLARGYYRVKR